MSSKSSGDTCAKAAASTLYSMTFQYILPHAVRAQHNSQTTQVNTIQLLTMPGLLQTQAEHFTKTKYVMALCAEFLGSMLFTFTGSALLSVALADPENPNVVLAALGNAAGITIAGCAYMLAQVVGSVFGSLLIAGLIPDSYIGMGNKGTGCFAPSAELTNGMTFGWEFFLSFILVATVYACAIGAPNFGNVAPLAVGVSLALDIMAGAAYSGSSVSPARVLGPAIVFHCHWNTAWVMALGDMIGGVFAGLTAIHLYGDHAKWIDPLMPWGEKHHDKSVSMRNKGNNEEKKYQVDQGTNAVPLNNEVMTTGKSDMPMMPSNHDSAMV
ncbi:TPA: hypothetical protein ACH3X2_000536 [Trebouxia sp. C0005]